MRDRIYYGLYRMFAFVLLHVSAKVRNMMVSFLGNLAYRISRRHKRVIAKNLDIAYRGELSQAEKKTIGIEAFKNLADTVFGIVEHDGLSPEEVLKNVTFEGREIIQEYISRKKNFILVTGHYGNWELLSQAIALEFGLSLVGVGRKLDSDLMDRILKQNREKFNVEMVYKKGALKGCIDAIRRDKTVGILIDQHIRKNQSINVLFFGERATHTPLASILSRKFGLDLIPAFIHSDDYRHYHVRIYDPIRSLKTDNQEQDLAILTQLQADIMEKVIREDPKQWFWMHNRWKRGIASC